MSRYPTDPDFEPRVADWLEADPDLAPAPVLSTVLAAFPSIPQRRASRVPWRFQSMSTIRQAGDRGGRRDRRWVGGHHRPAAQRRPHRRIRPLAAHRRRRSPHRRRPSPSPDGCAVGAAAERDVHVAHEQNLDQVTPWVAHETCHTASRWTATRPGDTTNRPLHATDRPARINRPPVHRLLASQPLAGKTGDHGQADTRVAETAAPSQPGHDRRSPSGMGSVIECNNCQRAVARRWPRLRRLARTRPATSIGGCVRPAWFEQLLDDDRPASRRTPLSARRAHRSPDRPTAAPFRLASLDGEASLFVRI